jgi:hypothetical protein
MSTRKLVPWVAAAALVFVVAGSVLAFGMGNVDGVWGDVDGAPGQGGATCLRYASWANGYVASGEQSKQTPPNTDENQVRYGQEVNHTCSSTSFTNQSGFGFDGNNQVGTLPVNQPFYLGSFTHYNRPIQASNLMEGVNLRITTSVNCNDGTCPTEGCTMTFDYWMYLDETPNQTPCEYPGNTVCPDRVLVTQVNPSQAFTCPEGQYTIFIEGFVTLNPQTGTCDQPGDYDAGRLSPAYVTEEGQANRACLWAQIAGFDPTAVNLQWFKARGVDRAVKLGWSTASELDNAGFNLYRSEQVDAQKTKINTSLIPTNVPPGSPFGAVYQYKDKTAVPGVLYFYWLQDVDIYGKTQLHGPVKARALAP